MGETLDTLKSFVLSYYGIVILCIIVFLLIVACYCCFRRRQKTKNALVNQHVVVSYNYIASDNHHHCSAFRQVIAVSMHLLLSSCLHNGFSSNFVYQLCSSSTSFISSINCVLLQLFSFYVDNPSSQYSLRLNQFSSELTLTRFSLSP